MCNMNPGTSILLLSKISHVETYIFIAFHSFFCYNLYNVYLTAENCVCGETGFIMADDSIRFISSGVGLIRCGGLYPSRKNDYNELLYVTGGCLYICEDYSQYRVGEGELILLGRSRRRYGFRECDTDTRFRRVIFGGDTGETYMSANGRRLFTPAHPERLQRLLDMLSLYGGLPEYPADALDSILHLVLVELFVYGIQRDDNETRRAVLCGSVCDYIRVHGGAIKPSQVAAHFGHTVRYLTGIFRGFYSKGIKAYTDAVRLAGIKELLGSGITLSETASSTGFASVKAMQNFFRYQTDMTMREWSGEAGTRKEDNRE